MEDLLNRSALLRQAILSTVDHPLADDSSRLLASMDAALLSLEHGGPSHAAAGRHGALCNGINALPVLGIHAVHLDSALCN